MLLSPIDHKHMLKEISKGDDTELWENLANINNANYIFIAFIARGNRRNILCMFPVMSQGKTLQSDVGT